MADAIIIPVQTFEETVGSFLITSNDKLCAVDLY